MDSGTWEITAGSRFLSLIQNLQESYIMVLQKLIALVLVVSNFFGGNSTWGK